MKWQKMWDIQYTDGNVRYTSMLCQNVKLKICRTCPVKMAPLGWITLF